MVDHVAAVGGRGFLLPLVDFSLDDIEAGVAFDGVLTPLNPRALPGRLDFLTPWHVRAPRNASWSDFPLRDRRSRRLWGNRKGRLAQRSRGRHPVRANGADSNCPPTSRKVQWIPFQIEGYNEGNEAG